MDDPQAFAALLGTWRGREFRPFRDGVEICVLRPGAPGVALLRYAPGAGVPRHRHPALETILVLEGVQSDERGDYPAGSLILNPEGTEHSVWSEAGCTVLIQWNLPVEFVA
ncbi:allophanate hydrolase [Tabrizicola sp. TH137]|uniref:cupin domain-containing protein n=1 Tax=Tabrizicola sp. TH137 TaxID=2067452 RepID=UPI000C7B1737|nr:cupin domain-containing protein [Tabrizicola sp. TH137]PLL11575.1 allophanate hydrolase [Tabrizicola sp. TH137]